MPGWISVILFPCKSLLSSNSIFAATGNSKLLETIASCTMDVLMMLTSTCPSKGLTTFPPLLFSDRFKMLTFFSRSKEKSVQRVFVNQLLPSLRAAG